MRYIAALALGSTYFLDSFPDLGKLAWAALKLSLCLDSLAVERVNLPQSLSLLVWSLLSPSLASWLVRNGGQWPTMAVMATRKYSIAMQYCKTRVSGGAAGTYDWCELLEINYIRYNFEFD